MLISSYDGGEGWRGGWRGHTPKFNWPAIYISCCILPERIRPCGTTWVHQMCSNADLPASDASRGAKTILMWAAVMAFGLWKQPWWNEDQSQQTRVIHTFTTPDLQGGHCFGGNKIKDFSRIFKQPHKLFSNLFDHSLQHVKQLYSNKSVTNTDVHYIAYSSPVTAAFLLRDARSASAVLLSYVVRPSVRLWRCGIMGT